MHHRSIRLMVALAAMVMVGLAGCSKTPSTTAAPKVTIPTRTLRTLPPPTSTPAGSQPGPDATTAPPASAPPPATSPFCALIRRYDDRVAAISSVTADGLPQLLSEVTAAIEGAAPVAPAPVQGDVTMMAGAHRRFLTALDQAGYDPAKLTPAAAGELKAPAYLAARERVRAFSRANCPQ